MLFVKETDTIVACVAKNGAHNKKCVVLAVAADDVERLRLVGFEELRQQYLSLIAAADTGKVGQRKFNPLIQVSG